MLDTGQPSGTGPPSTIQPEPSMTPTQVGDGPNQPRRMRSFQEIIEDEKKNRNILTVKLSKIVSYVDGKEERPPSLNMEDIGELIFDVMKLKVEDTSGLSLNTNRYDTKEIRLKPGIDPTPYLYSTPFEFKQHMITVTQLRLDTTKVTFKNVPWNIPDEEIINLCECYGTPLNNVVNYEPMPRAYRGVRGPNRSVDVKMIPGKQFENFYWLEGPLEEDKGSRVTVLHQGQEPQCSHCLRRGNCPGGGNGKVCSSMNTPRGKLADYMKYLKISHNYLSLKMKYKQQLESDFPALGKQPSEFDEFGHIVEDDDDDEEVSEASIQQVQVDPTVDSQLEINPGDFDYDAEKDEIIPKDHEAFNKFVETHPTVNKLKRDKTRDEKVASLKEKVLETLKVHEKKKRDISCESVQSGCSGWDSGGGRGISTESRGKVRNRSDDSDDDREKPKSDKQARKSRPYLKPPKIILTQ